MTTVTIGDSEYTLYRKANTQPLRDYIPGEDLTGVSVSERDTPGVGGKIAVNPSDPKDRWYVAADFFSANYVPA